MDGFYAAYLTGRADRASSMFAIRGDDLIGVDAGGLKYDGKVVQIKGGWNCTVVYTIPAGSPSLITGRLLPRPTSVFQSSFLCLMTLKMDK